MGTPWDLTARIGLPIPINVDGAGGDPFEGRKPTSWELWSLLCSSGRVSLEELKNYPHGLSLKAESQYVDESEESGELLNLANGLMMDELGSVAFETPDDWPFHLVSRRMWEYHNSWGQDIQKLRNKIPVNPAFLHPDDLAMLGIEDGQGIRIVSAAGEVEAIAQGAPELRRGVVSMSHCWGDAFGSDARSLGSNTNQLVDHAHPGLFIGMPRMSAIGVRVEMA